MVEELRRLLLRRVHEWAIPGVPDAGVSFVHPFRDEHELEREGDGTPILRDGPPEYDVPGHHIHAFVLAVDIREGATSRYYERTTERCDRHAGTRWDDLSAELTDCPDCRKGHIVKIATVDGKPGSPFKVYSGAELEKAIVYELSHVAVLKGKHSVSEFGVLKLLPAEEDEPKEIVCPEHGVAMTPRPPTAETFEALSVKWIEAPTEGPPHVQIAGHEVADGSEMIRPPPEFHREPAALEQWDPDPEWSAAVNAGLPEPRPGWDPWDDIATVELSEDDRALDVDGYPWGVGDLLPLEVDNGERTFEPVAVHKPPGSNEPRPVCRIWDLDDREKKEGQERATPKELSPRTLALELGIGPPEPPPGFRQLVREFNESYERALREKVEAAEYRAGSGPRSGSRRRRWR